MFYNYYEDYQYNNCLNKSMCTIGLKTTSLHEVLIVYLKLLAFYTIELKKLGIENKNTKTIILNSIFTYMSNIESEDKQFIKLIIDISKLLLESKTTYIQYCESNNIEPKHIKTNIKLNNKINIQKLIQFGEKEYIRRIKKFSQEKKNLFEIMAYILKSICINLIELNDYKENNIDEKYFNQILVLLNFLNYINTNISDILNEINTASIMAYKLGEELYNAKIKQYGEPNECSVSLSTIQNKSILVSGDHLPELEKILEYTKNHNIDIYTHGEMIFAHTYPLLKKYKQLKGHFGNTVENNILDLSNFPGAILLTKFASQNIEYLYRGRLFTTDYIVPKGAIKISNDDYSKIVESALNAKGFKHKRNKTPILVGFNQDNINTKLDEILTQKDKYKNIIVIGPEVEDKKNKLYFECLLKNLTDEIFVISFSYYKNYPNILSLNGFSEFSIVYSIVNKLNKNFNISIFIPKCDKHTVPNAIALKQLGVKHIFLSKCAPTLIKPTLTESLNKIYDINLISKPLIDLKKIINS